MQGDHLAHTLLTYAKKETFNSSTQDALSKFAENFSAVQDYRNAQVDVTSSRLLPSSIMQILLV